MKTELDKQNVDFHQRVAFFLMSQDNLKEAKVKELIRNDCLNYANQIQSSKFITKDIKKNLQFYPFVSDIKVNQFVIIKQKLNLTSQFILITCLEINQIEATKDLFCPQP
ncbi:hypothetical protein ABPG74_019863 [Tetrahymena malaccensis]